MLQCSLLLHMKVQHCLRRLYAAIGVQPWRWFSLTRAAAGWCSCAVGVPAGRCAASAFSVLSSEITEHTHREKADSSHLYGSRPLPPTGIKKLRGLGAWQSIVLIDPFTKACKRSYSEGAPSNLSSDDSGGIQTTNNETRPREISEIKQSKWVITQVWTFIPVGQKNRVLLRISFKRHKKGICSTTIPKRDKAEVV